MPLEWFYVRNARQRGPVQREELDRLIQSGELPDDTLVWCESMENWQPYKQTIESAAATTAQGAPLTQPGAQPTAPLPAAGPGETKCSECGGSFPERDLVPFGRKWVCPGCKPLFLQKLKEGVALDPATAVPDAGGQNPMAVAGFVLGIAGLVLLCGIGLVPGILGLIFSTMGVSRANADPEQTDKGLATAGIWLSAVAILLNLIVLILFLMALTGTIVAAKRLDFSP